MSRVFNNIEPHARVEKLPRVYIVLEIAKLSSSVHDSCSSLACLEEDLASLGQNFDRIHEGLMENDGSRWFSHDSSESFKANPIPSLISNPEATCKVGERHWTISCDVQRTENRTTQQVFNVSATKFGMPCTQSCTFELAIEHSQLSNKLRGHDIERCAHFAQRNDD